MCLWKWICPISNSWSVCFFKLWDTLPVLSSWLKNNLFQFLSSCLFSFNSRPMFCETVYNSSASPCAALKFSWVEGITGYNSFFLNLEISLCNVRHRLSIFRPRSFNPLQLGSLKIFDFYWGWSSRKISFIKLPYLTPYFAFFLPLFQLTLRGFGELFPMVKLYTAVPPNYLRCESNQ